MVGAVGGADVVVGDELLAELVHLGAVEHAPRAKLGRAVLLEGGVFGNGERQDQPALLAVFMDGRNLVVDHVARSGVLDLDAAHAHLATLGLGEAGDGLNQLFLAVAVDARNAHDLAGMHREAEALDGLDAALILNMQVGDLEDGLAGLGGLLVHGKVDVVAHHHVGKLLFGHVVHVHLVHVLAATDDGAGLGGRLDLLELVGDDDDRLAGAGEVAHDLDQALDLLRGQHGGGFVEDQDVPRRGRAPSGSPRAAACPRRCPRSWHRGQLPGRIGR